MAKDRQPSPPPAGQLPGAPVQRMAGLGPPRRCRPCRASALGLAVLALALSLGAALTAEGFVGFAGPAGSPVPKGTALSGTLYFTSFGGCQQTANGKEANVFKVSFTYIVGQEFSLKKPEGVTCTKDLVDGLVFAPDGDLLVGAKAEGVHKINPQTGAFTTIKLPQPVFAFHLMVDPSGTKLWVSGIPGKPATVPLTSGGKVALHAFIGDDPEITTIAWDHAGNAYYTSSGAAGGGSFGRIDFDTMTTKRIQSWLPAAHGMTFDPYTRNLILMGSKHVTQMSVGAAPATVSDWTAPIEPLDQGSVDGKGHLFAACNCGRMVFLDYSATRKVADPRNFTATVYLVDTLDDIAPLAGPGAQLAPTPPGSVQVTEEQGRIRIVLESEILFDLDKYNLKPSAEAALARIKASIIDKHPGARLIIEGHTDDRGSQEYNQTLSTKRAQSVAAWLTQHGVQPSLLQTVGYGKMKPRVPNTSEANRARNRRVEIVVLK